MRISGLAAGTQFVSGKSITAWRCAPDSTCKANCSSWKTVLESSPVKRPLGSAVSFIVTSISFSRRDSIAAPIARKIAARFAGEVAANALFVFAALVIASTTSWAELSLNEAPNFSPVVGSTA